MPTIQKLLRHGGDKIKHLKSSLLDSEILLSFVLGKPREHLLSHGEDEVRAGKIERFNGLISRRAKREPVAYLTNRKEFYGRSFFVDERVHIPRPSTEDLIDRIKESIPKNFSGRLADIGTGSGCIAVIMALEFPQAKILATDISRDALDVAGENARHLGADKIEFFCGDLLSPLPGPVEVMAANLPYGWPGDWTNDSEVFFQPRESYDGTKNGLGIIQKFLSQLPNYLANKGLCFLEFDPRRTNELQDMLKTRRLTASIHKDSAGFERIACLTNNLKQS